MSACPWPSLTGFLAVSNRAKSHHEDADPQAGPDQNDRFPSSPLCNIQSITLHYRHTHTHTHTHIDTHTHCVGEASYRSKAPGCWLYRKRGRAQSQKIRILTNPSQLSPPSIPPTVHAHTHTHRDGCQHSTGTVIWVAALAHTPTPPPQLPTAEWKVYTRAGERGVGGEGRMWTINHRSYYILRLQGWRRTVGLKAAITHASQQKKYIKFI